MEYQKIAISKIKWITLLLIIFLAEVICMIFISLTGVDKILSPFQLSLFDGFLLTLISMYPIYKFVIKSHIENTLKLHKDKFLYSHLLNAVASPVIISDKENNIVYINDSFLNLFKYSSNQIIGKSISILSQSNKSDLDKLNERLQKVKEKGVFKGQLESIKSDGDVVEHYVEITQIEYLASTYSIGIYSDLGKVVDEVELKKEAEKLKSIQILVGGIAHNFNNILMGTYGILYTLKEKVSNDLWVDISKLEVLSRKSSEIVKQLLAYSGQNFLHTDIFDVKELAAQCIEDFKKNEKVNFIRLNDSNSIKEKHFKIVGDKDLIRKSIKSIIQNAIEALELNHHENLTLKEIKINIYECNKNNCNFSDHCELIEKNTIVIEIINNGRIIDSKIIKQIFDPFYTTKDQSAGAGLGLSLVKGIIESHKGYIEVKSNKRDGTVFKICLPIYQNITNDQKLADLDDSEQLKGQLILLVEDDEVVINVVKSILENLGINVIFAKNGKDGLDLFKLHQNQISLIVSDLLMPEISGNDMVLKIREIKSNIPVVFMTGYMDSEQIKLLMTDERTKVLLKPFVIEQFIKTIFKLMISDH